jgi:nitroreductase
MNTLDAINNRRSIRRYVDRPVEFEKITTILDATVKAPSAGNLQDWRFVIITDKNLIKQVAQYSIDQYWIQTAPVLILVCAVPEKHELYYGLRGKRLYNIQDCAAAINTLELAAVDQGLSTCWIGAFEEDKIRSIFAVPSDVRPQAIISMGYSDETPRDRNIVPLETVVFFNRYGMKIEKLHIVLRDYSEEWPRQRERFKESTGKHFHRLKEEFHKIKSKVKEQFNKKN